MTHDNSVTTGSHGLPKSAGAKISDFIDTHVKRAQTVTGFAASAIALVTLLITVSVGYLHPRSHRRRRHHHR